MTPSASAAAWRPPASKSRGWRRVGQVVVVAMVSAVAAQYLAGYALLWSLDRNPKGATPLTVARYAYYYGDRPDIRQRAVLTSALGLIVVLAGALVFVLPRGRALHGDARFARRGEIRRAGLLGDHGIILGRLGNRCLMLPGQQGVALAAPPRAGKGTGVVVPNLLNWPDSLICIDIKRENWTLTAGFRKAAGQACYLFDPFAEDGATARWNPFFYVSADSLRRVKGLFPEALTPEGSQPPQPGIGSSDLPGSTPGAARS